MFTVTVSSFSNPSAGNYTKFPPVPDCSGISNVRTVHFTCQWTPAVQVGHFLTLLFWTQNYRHIFFFFSLNFSAFIYTILHNWPPRLTPFIPSVILSRNNHVLFYLRYVQYASVTSYYYYLPCPWGHTVQFIFSVTVMCFWSRCALLLVIKLVCFPCIFNVSRLFYCVRWWRTEISIRVTMWLEMGE